MSFLCVLASVAEICPKIDDIDGSSRGPAGSLLPRPNDSSYLGGGKTPFKLLFYTAYITGGDSSVSGTSKCLVQRYQK